jgi:hypothetical protein
MGICPTPQHGVEAVDEPGRGRADGLLAQGLHLRCDARETALAGRYLQLGRFAMEVRRLPQGLPEEVKPLGDGRNDGLFR